MGGSFGEVAGEKVARVMDLAMEAGVPVIGINDGGGARIQEGITASMLMVKFSTATYRLPASFLRSVSSWDPARVVAFTHLHCKTSSS